MLENLTPARRNLILALIGALFLWFVWSIRAVVNPLLLGYLAAYILHPMVVKLERRGMSRRKAVNLIFLAGFVGTIVVVGGIAMQGKSLVQNVVSDPDLRAQVNTALQNSKVAVEEYLPFELPEIDLQTIYTEFMAVVAPLESDPAVGAEGASPGEAAATGSGGASAVREFGVKAASSVWARLKGIFGSVIGIGGLIFLVPLYAYYLLFELGRMHASVRRYLPKADRESISNIGRQIGQMLAAFFRGRLLVCLIKGLIISVGLLLFGFDYAFLFGMLAGFLSLIPVVGPFLGFLLAAVASIPVFKVTGDVEGAAVVASQAQFVVWKPFLFAAIVFGLAELIEGYVLMPKILGDSLRMNEVEVLFYLMAGAASLGMFGVLVALPIAAALKILLKEAVLPALARFADDDPGRKAVAAGAAGAEREHTGDA